MTNCDDPEPIFTVYPIFCLLQIFQPQRRIVYLGFLLKVKSQFKVIRNTIIQPLLEGNATSKSKYGYWQTGKTSFMSVQLWADQVKLVTNGLLALTDTQSSWKFGSLNKTRINLSDKISFLTDILVSTRILFIFLKCWRKIVNF
jgi:hypothetical protein